MTQPDDQTVMKRRLGRGLNALLGAGPAPTDDAADTEEVVEAPASEYGPIDVNLIDRNPFQPRTEFEPAALTELVDSIRLHGILQPLLVRPYESGYQLIAGERRLIAARKAELTTVPCIVRELDDQRVCEAAIDENLKRKDLNVLEKAKAFQDYMQRFNTSIEELAKRLSLDRSTVSNFLRLLELAEPVKLALRTEKITNGHARALLALEEAEQVRVCEQIEKESLSVRKTEALVRSIVKGEATVPFKDPKDKPADPPTPTNHVLSIQEQLRNALGAKVEIKLSGKDSGKIIIHFHNNDDFERVVGTFRRAA